MDHTRLTASLANDAGITSLTGRPAAAPATPRPCQVILPGEPASVTDARHFVRDTLTACTRADDLAQAVTELAANAVAWSAAREQGTFTVAIRTAPRWARIEVTDPGPATHPAPAAGNGFGLGIVAAITDRSGTTHGPGTTRTAWAEVTWPARTLPRPAPPRPGPARKTARKTARPGPTHLTPLSEGDPLP